MTCREFVEFLADYLDGALTSDESGRFDRHLAACPSCVAYMKGYRDAIRLGQAALLSTDEPVPGAVPEKLLEAILRARESAP